MLITTPCSRVRIIISNSSFSFPPSSSSFWHTLLSKSISIRPNKREELPHRTYFLLKKDGDTMANPLHLKKLDKDVNAWNTWRNEHPDIFPDLSHADLSNKVLSCINFHHTNLDNANVQNTKLDRASLVSASFSQANLSGATLRHTNLRKTFFQETILHQTNLHEAYLMDTMFLNVDLSTTLNLATVHHPGASTIGIDTLQRSRGNIPNNFLLNAGVSEQLLTSIAAFGKAPFDYATCFISHSSRNKRFVEILCHDLRKAGVSCWYADESLYPGEKFPASIAEAIQSREKVLVVLSKHALKSDWVRREVELARQKEGKRKKDILVPIRLDNAIESTEVAWGVALRTQQRHISNFENWRQAPRYQKRLQDVLNALRR
jgi:TIR domain/Pentapeptide repeats (8 copies)